MLGSSSTTNTFSFSLVLIVLYVCGHIYFHRQHKRKLGPFAQLALHPNAPLMRFNYLFADGQSQPAALRLADVLVLSLVKLVEYLFVKLGVNALAIVHHIHFNISVDVVTRYD